jgi:3',5'-cyclic AMP phosphodiesterase CpdA
MTPWTFAHINDTQPGSPRSYRYKPALQENEDSAYAQLRALKPELLLVGGDLTRDGVLHEFELWEAKARLDALGIPYHAIPGNMDVGNRVIGITGSHAYRHAPEWTVSRPTLQNFAKVFGEFPWTLVHRDVRFTGIYAAVTGSGLAEEAQFWDFMGKLAEAPRARHHVLVMHYAPFIEHPDEPEWDANNPEQYHDAYFTLARADRLRLHEAFLRAGVEIVLSGHIHCRRPVQVRDGIRFYKTAAPSFPQWTNRWPDGDGTLGFYTFEVSDAGIRETFVPLTNPSNRPDSYGPGGHPAPETRDYRLAWVK